MNNSLKAKFNTISVKIIIAAMIATSVIIAQTGCSSQQPISKSDFCLNTTCEIKIYDMPAKEAEAILENAFAEIRRYESIFSRTVEESEIYKINNAKGTPVEVSDDVIEVLEQSMYMSVISEGKFDVTVGELTSIWNFTGENPSVPDKEDVEKALQSTDYNNIVIEGNTVVLTNAQTQIDLGGIAKGYIADRITEYLKECGVASAVINLGGNIALVGTKPDGSMWNIGIERPYSDRTELIGSVAVRDATVVTSGVYERKFEEDGVLYHHVLDPETGFPAETDLEAVTITAAAGNSGFCDALATICLMLGTDEAIKLVEELQQQYPEKNLQAALIDKEDRIVQTDGMEIEFQ